MKARGWAGWTAGFACLSVAFAISSAAPAGALPPFERPALAGYAALDTASVLAGVRRFGADLAFIQLLQYLADEDAPQDVPDTLAHARRSASLSPFFRPGILFGAGVLGFVFERTEEALALLKEGAERDPSFWRYRLYAGAIAYRTQQRPDLVIPLLEEAIRYDDCPAMVENILGNLHMKLGHYQRAAEVFAHVVATSRDQDYVSAAREKLERLHAEYGVVPG